MKGDKYNAYRQMTLSAVPLAAGLSFVDLRFQGRANAIATAVVQAPGAVALIDPGPSPCLETLELGLNGHGLGLAEVTDILLTHIHLDHAGATGTILRRHPQIRVHVHERGAPHLVDPSKLLASAARLYGDDMDRLWGEVAPVPAGSIRVLHGGERMAAGGRTFDVAYTPGHASHHVSFFDRASGVAFVGDTAGVCIKDGYVLPPTPPPDIDLDLWQQSIARIEAWSPATLFITHFGPLNNVRTHLQTLSHNLAAAAERARELLAEPGSEDEREARFLGELELALRRHGTDATIASYHVAAPPHVLWLGLARYWRKRSP